MKKSYNKAEAFKVNFNAKEQVAAACTYTAEDYSSKYPVAGEDATAMYCYDNGGTFYSDETVSFCVIYTDGTTYMGDAWDYNTMVQYS